MGDNDLFVRFHRHMSALVQGVDLHSYQEEEAKDMILSRRDQILEAPRVALDATKKLSKTPELPDGLVVVIMSTTLFVALEQFDGYIDATMNVMHEEGGMLASGRVRCMVTDTEGLRFQVDLWQTLLFFDGGLANEPVTPEREVEFLRSVVPAIATVDLGAAQLH